MSASRSVVVVVLPFPSAAGVVPLLSAMTASRCRSHGYVTTSDLGVAIARKIIQVKMAHRALHLIDVDSRVSIHHVLDALVLRSNPLYTGALESSSVGNRIMYPRYCC